MFGTHPFGQLHAKRGAGPQVTKKTKVIISFSWTLSNHTSFNDMRPEGTFSGDAPAGYGKKQAIVLYNPYDVHLLTFPMITWQMRYVTSLQMILFMCAACQFGTERLRTADTPNSVLPVSIVIVMWRVAGAGNGSSAVVQTQTSRTWSSQQYQGGVSLKLRQYEISLKYIGNSSKSTTTEFCTCHKISFFIQLLRFE